MGALPVTNVQRDALVFLDTLLDEALGSGVVDETPHRFIDGQLGYLNPPRLSPDQQKKAREFGTALAAAMMSAGITGGGGGGGTVTLVNTGPGLTGGPISTTGTISIATGGVTNAMLANSSLSVIAGAGLINGGLVSLGGSTTLDIGAGDGITVNADDVAVDATVVRLTATQTLTNKTLVSPAFTSSVSAASVATVRNSSITGYSTLTFLDWNNVDKATIGYANDSVVPASLQAHLYLASSRNILISTYTPETIATFFTTGKNFNLGQTTTDTGVKLNVEADATSAGIGLGDGGSLAVSAANTVRVRYSSATQVTQLSENGGAYDGIVLLTKSQELTNKTLTAMVVKNGLTATGSVSNDFSGSTGTFKTSTGAVSLAGNTTVLTGKTFSIADMTTGSIPYFGTSGLMSQDNTNFFWDATNKRLGLGTTTPGVIGGSTDITGTLLHLKSTTLSTFAIIEATNTSGNDAGILLYSPAIDNDAAIFLDDSDGQKLKVAIGVINTDANRISQTKITLTQTGNLGLGTTGPLSRLDVSGGIAVGTYAGNNAAPTNGLIVSGNVGFGIASVPSPYSFALVASIASDVPMIVRNTNTTGYSGIRFEKSDGNFEGAIGKANASGSLAYLANNNFLLSGGVNGTTSATNWVFANLTGVKFTFGMSDSNTFMEMVNGSSSANSTVSTGRLIYNSTTQTFRASLNNLAYGDVLAGNGLYFLPTTFRVGIGTAASTPAWALDIRDANTGGECISIRNLTSTGYSDMVWFDSSNTQKGGVGYANASVGATGLQSKNFFYTPNVDWVMGDGTTNFHRWYNGASAIGLEMSNGGSATTSLANTGKLAYFSSTQELKLSKNTGAYERVYSGNRADASNTQVTTTSATSIVTLTPPATGNYEIRIYYRVVTASTTVTITVTWTDPSGAQTLTLVNAVNTAVGSYVLAPTFINATAAAITVTATAGTANQLFVSADIQSV